MKENYNIIYTIVLFIYYTIFFSTIQYIEGDYFPILFFLPHNVIYLLIIRNKNKIFKYLPYLIYILLTILYLLNYSFIGIVILVVFTYILYLLSAKYISKTSKVSNKFSIYLQTIYLIPLIYFNYDAIVVNIER